MNLNGRSLGLVESLLARAEERKVAAHPIERGGRFVDCGIEARGGLRRGSSWRGSAWRTWRRSRSSPATSPAGPARSCRSSPIIPCEPAWPASTPAGRSSEGKFFAMGSGPMRAAWGHEPIFEKIGHRETVPAVVGVLEGRKTPTPAVVAKIASSCGVAPSAVTLLVAPTASLAGGIQVVARSVETALHKLVGAGLRPVPGRGRRTGPPRCRRSPPTTSPRSAGPTTRSSTAPASSCTSPATTPASKEIGPQGPLDLLARPRRAVRGDLRPLQQRLLRRRSPPVQPGRGRLPERRDRPRPRLRPDRPPTSSSGRSSPEPIVDRSGRWTHPVHMLRFVALVSGFGWHVQDLRRAAGRLGLDARCGPVPRRDGSCRDGRRAGRRRGGSTCRGWTACWSG